MSRLIALVVLCGWLALPAAAEQYWVSYEGDAYPEDVGWTRIFGDETGPLQGGAERSIENGALVVDSLRSTQIFDFYQIERPLDPLPGEVFVAQWRLRIDTVLGVYDPVVGIRSDGNRAVGFQFSDESVISAFEVGIGANLDPYAFHEYELRTFDMLTYELFIDGALAFTGVFHDVTDGSRIGWGDAIQGAASESAWDYFRFGVVPEASSGVLFAFASTCVALLARRKWK